MFLPGGNVSGCHQHLQMKVNIESISYKFSITSSFNSQRDIDIYRSIKGVLAVTLRQKKPAHEKPENDNRLFKL